MRISEATGIFLGHAEPERRPEQRNVVQSLKQGMVEWRIDG